MDRIFRPSSLLVIASLCCVSALPTVAGEAARQTTIEGEACCFTNPSFTGVCRVVPGPDETCADILAYLNNQSSVGKTYCGNTKVRGGWAQVDCDGASSSCIGPMETPDGTDD